MSNTSLSGGFLAFAQDEVFQYGANDSSLIKAGKFTLAGSVTFFL